MANQFPRWIAWVLALLPVSERTRRQAADGEGSDVADLEIARTSRQLWDLLKRKAGLILSESPGAASAYDDAFMDELRRLVLGGAQGDFGELLEREDVSIERLLEGFLRAFSPYPWMAREILEMFEAAAARSQDNISMAVDIDSIDVSLEFDLDHFRDFVRRLEPAIRLIARRDWASVSAWSVVPDLDEDLGLRGRLPQSGPVRAWIDQMHSGHDFPDLPALPLSGVTQFDEVAAELWADLRDFQGAARDLFGTYDGIIHTPSEGPPVRGWDRMFLRTAHDLWPREGVRNLAIFAELLRRDPSDPVLLDALQRMIAAVEAMSLPAEPREVMVETVEEILSLPAWKRRHELYSVWIASVITRTLEPLGLEYHVTEGHLAFPFRKTHVATIGIPNRNRLELWSELRSPAVDPIGRVGEVQPDYRVGAASAVGAGGDFLVVECKQYKRSSTRNFSAALTDYARASPGAQVVLANYGPVSDLVMAAVKPDVAGYCRAFGEVFPGGEGLPGFIHVIATVGTGVLGLPDDSGWSIEAAEVKLLWSRQGVDLDLFVTTPDGECGFDQPDGLAEVTYSGDDRGNGRPPFWEVMTIRPAESERFDIVVSAFSGVATVGEARPELLLSWTNREGSGGVEVLVLGEAASPKWHVATFEKGRATPVLVQADAAGFCTGKGWVPDRPS